MSDATPVQSVDQPIICSPYEEPKDHWLYDRETGEAKRGGIRRPAGYWYKTQRTGSEQTLFLEESRDDLTLVNLLREDVGRWRDSGYRGASKVTRDLLKHWAREDGVRRLFFCQREAVETMIYLCELRIPGRSSRTGFSKFALLEADLKRLLKGERPSFAIAGSDFFQTLIDQPANAEMLPLTRLGCKMATGSGKTVVMAMLITWAFCNRGVNRASREFPHGVLVCCPNLTVKERLQVLRPEVANNFYQEFDIVPAKYRDFLQFGKVLITNWHGFQEESEHREGDKSYAVVNKGPETRDSFARRILGDLYDRMPIMVFNDEGHHCWRPAPVQIDEDVVGEEKKEIEAEQQEARVWLNGLDKLNNIRTVKGGESGGRGILFCVDLSATPFYLKGSGHIEGSPFPWLVNDFGLVDAIECGIVKIPRLPVSDTTGRPEPKYFKLWEKIRDDLEPAEFLPGKARKPKPESIWREAQGALQQLADQWVERFRYMEEATPGQEHVPPVLIIVCDNIDISKLVYEKISGEQIEEMVTEEEVKQVLSGNDEEEDTGTRKKKKTKPKTITTYGSGEIHSEYFSNTETLKRTIRIDSKLLAQAESEDPKKKKSDAAEALRKVVSSVGKKGQPGEHVRCVVSVSMLTEGWDANNVTQILGIRAFKSQLLCEQVVGRGLRRMDYTPDPKTGLLTEEYVDVYGIPFSVIPFKGRPTNQPTPVDKPKQHVQALPERAEMEIRFPVVEGYAFALKQNLIRCDIDSMDPLILEPNREPTATFVQPTVGYQEGPPSGSGIAMVEQNRHEFYQSTHLQAIQFQITRLVMDRILSAQGNGSDTKAKVLRLQSRHQLFPQVYHFVNQYVECKVDFKQENPCELGLQKYVGRMVERLSDRIEPDESKGEPPLLPILNQYQPLGSTGQVDFKTVRGCFGTQNSHINQVVADTATWEQSAAFRLERAVQDGVIKFYARNDHMGLYIPYEYQDVDHSYEPDFLIRVEDGFTVLLEIKGYEDDQTRAKHDAARKWVSAVNNWRKLGWWAFHVCRDPQLIQDEIAQIPRPPSEILCAVE